MKKCKIWVQWIIFFILHGVITHLLNNTKKLYAAFIDFTKDFDYLVRYVIWYKLIDFGIRGTLLDIIRSMYNTLFSDDFICC